MLDLLGELRGADAALPVPQVRGVEKSASLNFLSECMGANDVGGLGLRWQLVGEQRMHAHEAHETRTHHRRHVHPKCLARWQLQSAGTRRETRCEFCDGSLPNWKEELTPITQLEAPAIMNVNFDGLSYSFEVQPGPEGYVAFTKAIRAAFNLPGDADLNITFTCDEPTSGARERGGEGGAVPFVSNYKTSAPWVTIDSSRDGPALVQRMGASSPCKVRARMTRRSTARPSLRRGGWPMARAGAQVRSGRAGERVYGRRALTDKHCHRARSAPNYIP